jgi:hypothetical protein
MTIERDDALWTERTIEATTSAPTCERRKPTSMTARRDLENMRARRVLEALERYRCKVCGRANPTVYCTKDRVRYVRCICGTRGVVIVEVRE